MEPFSHTEVQLMKVNKNAVLPSTKAMSEQTFEQDKLILRALLAEYIGQLPKPLHVVLSISSGSSLVCVIPYRNLVLKWVFDHLKRLYSLLHTWHNCLPALTLAINPSCLYEDFCMTSIS